MKVFGIADLHLSEKINKPMDKFGVEWINHGKKIKKNWQETVGKEDTVLIAGDISWAINLKSAFADLKYIESLNGNKVLIRGNHDYWWPTKNKFLKLMEDMNLDSIKFINNDFVDIGDFLVCGTRGWESLEREFEEKDFKIYKREIQRLENSIIKARKYSKEKKILVMMHYPPFNLEDDRTKFTEILEKYSVSRVLFGHIHGSSNIKEYVNKIKYRDKFYLVSVDSINFKPVLIIET